MNKSGILIFLVSIVLIIRIAYFYAQPDLCTDHISQMAMAQNFLDGNGFSFKYLNAQNEIYYKTHIQWPPLYPLLLALVTFITSNTLLSSFIIQIAVLIFLAYIWKKIFDLLSNFIDEDSYFFFIALLIISTSILNNINTILVLALLLLSALLYFTFAYLFYNKYKKSNLFFASFFASSLFWTHYSYYFVAYFPAIVLFIIYYLRKEKSHLRAGMGSFAISMVITSGVLIYNYVNTGGVNYMDNPNIWDAGFFPKHLLLADPFFLNAFFKSSYLLIYLFNKNYEILLNIIFQMVSFIILVIIVLLYLKLRKVKTILSDQVPVIFFPFLVLIVLTISFLLYFTLHYHEIPRPGWTHIGDARYLSPIYLSVLAIVILLVFFKADYLNNKILKFIRMIIISLIIVNTFINIYITYKEWGNYSYKSNTYLMPDQELQALFDNIKIELSKGNLPVFVDNELTVRSFRISQYVGAAVISEREAIGIRQFPSFMVFFFMLPEEKYYSKKNNELIEWGEKYNIKDIGKVYTNTKLFRVSNSKNE